MSVQPLLRSSLLYLVGSLSIRVVGFFMIPVYARFLSPSEYGVIELLELATQVLAISVGMTAAGNAMTRIYYEYPEGTERSAVVSSALLAVAGLGGLLAAGAAAFAAPLAELGLGARHYSGLVAVAFLAVAFSSITEVALVYQRLRNRPVFFVSYCLAQLAVNLSLNIYLIVFAGKGIWGFVIGKLITSLLGAAFLATVVLRETGMGFHLQPVRRMISFGSPLILASLASFVIHFSDRFFLKRFSTLTEIGIYALAYKFGFLVTYLVGEPFGRVWNVQLYKVAEREGWEDQFSRIGRYLVLCFFLAGLTISLFVGQALRVVAAPAFWAAAGLAPIVALAYVFREIGDFFRGLLYIDLRSDRVGYITLFCALTNLVLNYALISRFGTYGAAWATLLTWLVYLTACWRESRRAHRLSLSLASVMLLTALSTAVYAAGRLTGLGGVIGWGQNAALVVLFAALVWMSGYFPAGERDRIAGQLGRLRLRCSRGWWAVSHESAQR